MNQIPIFILRVIFSAVFAVVISKIFRPDATPLFTAGLGIFLLAASYGIEYFRKKKTENQ
jgi:carbon starvation protein CstA